MKISFTTANNDEFETLYLFLNHPIISIITKDRTHETLYSLLSSKKYADNYAIVYRLDLEQLKPKSILRTMILNKEFIMVDEIDYFEFIGECSESESESSIDLEEVKNKAISSVIQSIERNKEIESENQNRQIDIKINSISNYFEKQIARARRLSRQVSEEGVKRMRIGQIENLKSQRDEKIIELEKQKEIKSSFEILGVVEVVK